MCVNRVHAGGTDSRERGLLPPGKLGRSDIQIRRCNSAFTAFCQLWADLHGVTHAVCKVTNIGDRKADEILVVLVFE